MSYTCHVFTWIPDDFMEDWGYYNLGISGTVALSNSVRLKDPVFSYGMDGKLRIYPKSKFFQMYPADGTWDDYELWRYEFTTTSLSTFIEKMNQYKKGFSSESYMNSQTDYYLVVELTTDSGFVSYSRNFCNSFAAVANWTKWLGTNDLYNIFDNAAMHTYEKYLPLGLVNGLMPNEANFINEWVDTTYDESAGE